MTRLLLIFLSIFLISCASNSSDISSISVVDKSQPKFLKDRVGNSFKFRDDFVKSVFCKDFSNEFIPRSLFTLNYDGKKISSADIPVKIINKKFSHKGESFTAVFEIDKGVLNINVDVVIFKDFPQVEYTTTFENVSKIPSKIVNNFQALSLSAPFEYKYYGTQRIKNHHYKTTHKLDVRYSLGTASSPTDFYAKKKTLLPRFREDYLKLTTNDYRSSSSYMPYFSVDFSELKGINVSVGWTGGWDAEFSANHPSPNGDKKTYTHYGFSVGMCKSNFKVLAGEKLRNLSMSLQFRDNMSIVDAQNMHRRFMLAYHSPRDSKGNLLKTPICFLTWGGLETHKALERIKMIKEQNLPYELYWIDAGWSGADAPCPHFVEDTNIVSDWYTRIGNWRINRYAHPEGISKISEAVHSIGMKMLLWFEVERINKNSGASIIKERPDWLLSYGQTNYLINLADDNARNWLTNLICGYLRSEKIDYYRQDCNVNPHKFFENADSPDRVGVCEMKYLEGLHKYWNALKQRNPDILIDNCASGGRRLDFTMSNLSVALCQSDYQTMQEYSYDCSALQNYYLSQWVPMHSGLTWAPENDTYAFLSCFGTGVGDKAFQFTGREPRTGYNFQWHRKMLNLAKRLRDVKIHSNYYPLTENPQNFSVWLAQQFHLEDKDSGAFVCFRRRDCQNDTENFSLFEIDNGSSYEIERLDGSKSKISGKELANLTVVLAQKYSCEVIFYKKIK